MAINREIVYVLRMQNEARAAIQSLIADLHGLQGAITTSATTAAAAINSAGSSGRVTSPAVDAARAASITETAAANVSATTLRAATQAAGISQRANADEVATLLVAHGKVATMAQGMAGKLEESGLLNAEKIVQLRERGETTNAGILLEATSKAAVLQQKNTDSALLTAERVNLLQTKGQNDTAQTANKIANDTLTVNSRINEASLLNAERMAAVSTRAAGTTANETIRAQGAVDNGTLRVSLAAANQAVVAGGRVDDNHLKTQAQIGDRQLANSEMIINRRLESEARIEAMQLAAAARVNAIGMNAAAHGGGGGGFGGALSNMIGGIGGSTPVIGELTSLLTALPGAFLSTAGAVFAAYEAFNLVSSVAKKIITDGDEMSNMLNRLSSNMQQGANVSLSVFSSIEHSAQSSGQGLHEMVDQFVRFNVSMKPLGASNQELLKMTDTFSKLGAIAGGNSQRTAMAIYELSRGLAEGGLNARELRVILGDLPQLAQILAKGLGKNVSDLHQMAAAGQLTADTLRTALNKAGEDVSRIFNELPLTLSRASASAETSFTNLFANLDRKIGASKLLAAFLQYSSNAAQAIGDSISDNPADQQHDLQRRVADLQSQLAQEEQMAAGMQKAVPGLIDQTSQNKIKLIRDQIDAYVEYNIILQQNINAMRARDEADSTAQAMSGDRSRVLRGLIEVENTLNGVHKNAHEELTALEAALLAGDQAFTLYGRTVGTLSNDMTLLVQKLSPVAKAIADIDAATRAALITNSQGIGAANLDAKLRSIKNLTDKDGNALPQTMDLEGKPVVGEAAQAMAGRIARQEVIDAEVRLNAEKQKGVTLTVDQQVELSRLARIAGGRKGDTSVAYKKNEFLRQAEVKESPAAEGSPERQAAEAVALANMKKRNQIADNEAALSMVSGANKIANALQDQHEKTLQAQKALAAYEAEGARASALAALAEKGHSDALKVTRQNQGDVNDITSQFTEELVKERTAIGMLALDKMLDNQKEITAALQLEAQAATLTRGERERTLTVLKELAKFDGPNPLLKNTPKRQELKDTLDANFDLDQQTKFTTDINDRIFAYDQEAKGLDLVGDAAERQKLVFQLAADANKHSLTTNTQAIVDQQRALEALNRFQAARRAQQSDPIAGLKAGLSNTATDYSNLFGQLEGLTTRTFDSMATSIQEFAMTGKLNFSQFATSVIADMIKIVAEALLAKVALAALGFLSGGTSSALATQDIGFGAGNVFPTAHSGRIVGLSDSVNKTINVNSSVFSGARRYHSGGIPGLGSGEVPIIAREGEAIMPTTRMSDGTLGIRATGLGGGTGVFAPHNEIHIHNEGGGSGDSAADTKTAEMMLKHLSDAMDARFTDYMVRQTRSGGNLRTGRQFDARLG